MKPILPLAALLLASPTLFAVQNIVSPTSATQTPAVNFFSDANVANLSGLSGALGPFSWPSVTHGNASGGTAWTTNNPNGSGDYFLAGSPGPQAVFTLPLSQVEQLTDLVFWGYHFGSANGNESREFFVEFSSDGGSTFPSSTTVSLALGAHTVANPAALSFGGTFAADVVKITITDNQRGGGAAGGDRLGVGEFAFLADLPARDPAIAPAMESITVDSNGGPVPVTLDITNESATTTLNISAVTAGGPNAAYVTNLVFPATVAPSATAQITFDLDPAGATGTVDASITISSDDPIVGTYPIGIDGTIRNPKIDTVASVNLGSLLPSASPQSFTIDVNNLGASQNLTVSNGSLATGTAFTLDDDLATTNLVVTPAGTGQVNLTFNSSTPGTLSDTLELVSDDPVQGSTFIALEASVLHEPQVSAPAVVDAGSFPNGTGAQSFSVQVDNLGSVESLTLAPDPTVSGGDAGLFTVDSFDASIGTGGSGTINLTFDPAGAVGGFSTTLVIASNDPATPATQVRLDATVALPSLPGDLAAWWPLEDALNPGIDATGNGFDGALTGTVVTCPGASAATGNSMEFDGSNVIRVPWDPFLNSESFTVTLWANADASGGAYRSPITSRDDVPGGAASTNGYILYNAATGNWEFWTGDGAPGWETLTGPAVTTSVWTHLALSYDAGTQTKTIYVDGVVANTQTAAGLYAPNGPQRETLNIGGGGDDGGSFRFDGCIDDVAVFNSALSLADINTVKDHGVGVFLDDFDYFVASAGLSGADALPLADPDGDMLTNVEEFRMGLDPDTADSIPLTVTDGSTFTRGTSVTNVDLTSGLEFTVRFVRRTDGATSDTVEFSHDMNTWEPSAAVPTVISSDGSGFEVVEIRYPFFLSTGRKARFFHLVTTLN